MSDLHGSGFLAVAKKYTIIWCKPFISHVAEIIA